MSPTDVKRLNGQLSKQKNSPDQTDHMLESTLTFKYVFRTKDILLKLKLKKKYILATFFLYFI